MTLKVLAGQTAVYGLSSIVGRFLNYLLTPLYTYQFIAKDYGVVTEMYAYVAFLVVLLTYGMETTFFRFVQKSDDQRQVYSNVLIPILFTSGLFMLLSILFRQELAQLISYPDQQEIIVWFAIIVGLDAISSIPLAKLRHENKAAKFALINISSIAVNIALNVFFIAYCKVLVDGGSSNWLTNTFYNESIGVGYIFIANLIASIFKFVLLSPAIASIRARIDWPSLQNMFAYSWPLLLVGLAGIANENVDRLLLKYLLLDEFGLDETMTQVGIYGACYKVSILITLFVQAYRYAAEPFFFNQSTSEDAKETYALMMKFFIMICLFIFLGLMINIDLVMLFVGEEYRIGVVIVPILLAANILLGIYYNLSVWYKLTDRTASGAVIASVGTLITILANLALIPVLGYEGSAWATLMCYFSMTSISYFWGRKYYAIPYPIKRIGIYVFLAVMFYLLLIGIEWPSNSAKMIIGNAALIGLLLGAFFLERPKKIIT